MIFQQSCHIRLLFVTNFFILKVTFTLSESSSKKSILPLLFLTISCIFSKPYPCPSLLFSGTKSSKPEHSVVFMVLINYP